MVACPSVLPLWLNCNKIPSIKTKGLLWHISTPPVTFPCGFLPVASRPESVEVEVSCHLIAAVSALRQPQMWQRWGQSWHRCTSPQLYSLAHMASDAPQPQITGLQKHHATLSRNTSKLGHLLFARNSFSNGTLRHWSQEKDICHVHQKGKVNKFRDVVLWFGVFGFFRWLGLEVQQSMRR